MFPIPDWDEEPESKDTGHQPPMAQKEKEKKNKLKKHLKTMKSDVNRKLDSVINSPGLSQGLLKDADGDAEGAEDAKKKQSILTKGIKFAGFEDFCKFVDGQGAKKRKRSEPEEASSNLKKKARFALDKIKEAIISQPESGSRQEEKSKAEKSLESSRFRYLNEKLYTQSSAESFKMFKKDPKAFEVYHKGFQEQVQKWPQDPLQTVIFSIVKRTIGGERLTIADFGCGEAKLARALNSDHDVHSFDLVALNDLVTPCDMSKTPLKDASVDIAVFCLSLMGVNLKYYLREANRVLKPGGVLKIAEVESRFSETSHDEFAAKVAKFGFKLKTTESFKFFVHFGFIKKEEARKKVPDISLKPCFYKKR